MSQDELLTTILKNVSRAFYLSMRVLPDGVRQPISAGYLLARAADTISDTLGVPVPERLRRLRFFADLVARLDASALSQAEQVANWSEGATEGEVKLMRTVPQALQFTASLPAGDRQAVQRVVATLISGMVLDLERFPGRFTEIAELDNYTYLVAGCVGEFWSVIIAAHTPALRNWEVERWSQVGVRFGKALQLTNVLRDVLKDLENRRSYLPGLVRESWLQPDCPAEGEEAARRALANLNQNQIGDIMAQWLEVALGHYEAAIEYTLSLPWHCWRLRLAVIWPIAIGLATLTKLGATSGWLRRGQRIKVERRWVYRMLLLSAPLALCTPALRLWLKGWWRRALWGSQSVREKPSRWFLE